MKIPIFSEKLAEALRRFGDIEMEVANVGVERFRTVGRSSTALKYEQESGGSGGFGGVEKSKSALLPKNNSATYFNGGKKKVKELRAAVGEFYLSLILIQNYQVRCPRVLDWKLEIISFYGSQPTNQ